MELYNLAEDCEYGAMKAEMIRDRLVVGIQDTNLSERLQLDSELTLEKAKKSVHQREAVKEQQQELKTPKDANNMDELRARRRSGIQLQHRDTRTKPPKLDTPKYGSRTPKPTSKCSRCGKEQHPREKCPAKEATCHGCGRKGHYSSQCYSKTVAEIKAGGDIDTMFLDTISSDERSCWRTTINLNGVQVSFKLDTGAEVTAISEEAYQQIGTPIS